MSNIVKVLTEERDMARSSLREIARVGDTLSPQELINHAASGGACERATYAGQWHPHRSIAELSINGAALERKVAALDACCTVLEASLREAVNATGWRHFDEQIGRAHV